MGKIKELTCIVCPNSCLLKVEDVEGTLVVTGQRCKRGQGFAIEEVTRPMRMVCSTVATAFEEMPVVPVRLSAEVPKDRIFDVMKEIDKVYLDKALGAGEAVIENVLNLGADVILTSDVLKGAKYEQ